MGLNNAAALKKIMGDRTLRIWLMCVINDDLRVSDQSYTRERAAELCALRTIGLMLQEDMQRSNFNAFQRAQREYRALREEDDEFIKHRFDGVNIFNDED